MKRKIFLLAAVVALFFLTYKLIGGSHAILRLAGSEKSSAAQYKVKKKSPTFIDYSSLQDGDIIFQSSKSGQGAAIQLATHSVYSHCGMVFKEGKNCIVLEAVGPVKKTPIEEWITYGDNESFVVRRLIRANEVLTPSIVTKMKDEGKLLMNKKYDFTFEWSDDKIYCSELVWKIYQRATGMELSPLARLHDFDLTNPIVKEIIQERYGEDVPLDEKVISPGAIFDCGLLETVMQN